MPQNSIVPGTKLGGSLICDVQNHARSIVFRFKENIDKLEHF